MGELIVRSAHLHEIEAGALRAKYDKSGRITRYYIDFRHKFLDLHKELSASDLDILQNKADALLSSWDKKHESAQARMRIEAGADLAERLTQEESARLASLSDVLAHTLDVDDAVDWDTLKDKSGYREVPFGVDPPKLVVPQFGVIDRLFGGARKKKQLLEEQHARSVRSWEARKQAHEAKQVEAKAAFLEAQRKANAPVDALRAAWTDGKPEAIIEHATLVLESSDYGDLFQVSARIDYETDEKILLVEYELPSPDDMPTTKAVKFVKSTGEMKETRISVRDQKANYDSLCYQICLRTIHELFEADTPGNIDRILFNGFATSVDRSTGLDVRSAIMSIMTDRRTYLAIDLSRIDPKECFKALKGVSAASLHALSPIAPIMNLNRDDSRFVDGRETAATLNDATNLAAMSWEDFEHLVRELFEKEFMAKGGEVRVTQSSRDGGVDAVAFDPDPISGGKIVIQAKRYTRTVGVGAVRDLYGTTMNEGAMKGILVTTADYGPDAYRFAADKPLALMTGANLLYMLERHGIRAKIDLAAAREALAAG